MSTDIGSEAFVNALHEDHEFGRLQQAAQQGQEHIRRLEHVNRRVATTLRDVDRVVVEIDPERHLWQWRTEGSAAATAARFVTREQAKLDALHTLIRVALALLDAGGGAADDGNGGAG
jgi:hypothetical protein